MSNNTLIQGDNLPILQSLHQNYAGMVKCVFIDPPYNTNSSFVQCNNNLEHALWLDMMKPRLEWLWKFLSNDGSLWITIDDVEAHYLKVMCDEIFGRKSFVANIVWQKKYTIANDARQFSANHDHVLVYCKSSTWQPNRLPRTKDMNARYSNPDDDPRGPWKPTPLHAKSGTNTGFVYTFANGTTWSPPPGTFPRYSVERLKELETNGEISFPLKKGGTPRRKSFLSNMGDVVAPTIWFAQDVGHNAEAKAEVKAFNPHCIFPTPKPERLLHRILTLATNPGDLVLDAFAGSGTTGAVAHKMGRRWIMIEIDECCRTHIQPRIERVIKGEDLGGITKIAGWTGGGSYDSLF